MTQPSARRHVLMAGVALAVCLTLAPALACGAQVFRFQHLTQGTYFYTASTSERDYVIATLGAVFNYQGAVWNTCDVPASGVPVYRFYIASNGTHFYTASESEKELIRADAGSGYLYEGPAFYAYPSAGPGLVPVFHLGSVTGDSHFYTASDRESYTAVTSGGYAFWDVEFYADVTSTQGIPESANYPPIAADDCYDYDSGTTLSVGSPGDGVLANDVDFDGDAMSAAALSMPQHGSLVLNGNGTFTYTPDGGPAEDDSFTYTLTAGASTDQATVYLNGPLSAATLWRFRETASGLYYYTRDAAERDRLIAGITWVDLTPWPHGFEAGAWNISSIGPAPGLVPLYSLDDRSSWSHFYTTDPDERDWVLANLGALYSNDGVDYYVNPSPGPGLMPVHHFWMPGNGGHVYTANDLEAYMKLTSPGFEYQDVEFYADVTGLGTYEHGNFAPVAFDDSYDFAQDTALDVSVPLLGVLTNDVDVDCDETSVTAYWDPDHGMLSVYEDGTFTYVPNPGFRGDDEFTYEMSDGALTSQATVYLDGPGTPIGVYRFFHRQAGVHFYTAIEQEKNNVLATLSSIYELEGKVYEVDSTSRWAVQPLHRFYNFRKGVHFYTASDDEARKVMGALSWTYKYEGVSYNVSAVPVPNSVPVYRFYNPRSGAHFYTSSEQERDNVIRTLGHLFQYEGPVFYLPQ